MAATLKIVVPMAGWGTRMRPHTWSKPKPLISVAGKSSLDHLLEMFSTLPRSQQAEYIFIVNPYLGETQIQEYIALHYPNLTAHFIVQTEMKGQSHALWLAREFLGGPMIICFSDTLMETDFAFLADEQSDGVAWVKAVPDPRRFGVAEVDGNGWITRLIEKPQTVENNLVVVGCYYFKDSGALLAAIDEQSLKPPTLKGEYFLTDAISIMIAHGAKIHTREVDVWLDTGTIEATLETNRYMLEHGRDNSAEAARRDGLKVNPPVFIHPEAVVVDSVIGPYVSIGPGCQIHSAAIRNSILEAEVSVSRAAVSDSLIGRGASVEGRGAEGPAVSLNVGDDSSVRL